MAFNRFGTLFFIILHQREQDLIETRLAFHSLVGNEHKSMLLSVNFHCPNPTGIYTNSLQTTDMSIVQLNSCDLWYSLHRSRILLKSWKLTIGTFNRGSEDELKETTIISSHKVTGLCRPVVDSDASSEDETSTDDETKWFWQKLKQPETATAENDDDSSTTDSEKPEEDNLKNKPPKSICSWCTVI